MRGPCRCDPPARAAALRRPHTQPLGARASDSAELAVRQAAVRSFLARESARQAVRGLWDAQASAWAANAERPEAEAGAADAQDPLCAGVIGAFMFFFTPRQDAARARLVAQLMNRLLRGGPSTSPHSPRAAAATNSCRDSRYSCQVICCSAWRPALGHSYVVMSCCSAG